jgi:hypothetical protein
MLNKYLLMKYEYGRLLWCESYTVSCIEIWGSRGGGLLGCKAVWICTQYVIC